MGGRVTTRLRVDARGRPVQAFSFDDEAYTGSLTYDWTGDRLVAIRQHDPSGKPTWTTELLHDCRDLPAHGRAVNAGQPPGVPSR